MAEDIIRYDLLVQEAMRSVMRKVLADVEAAGYLPGEHHFTISFRTDDPGAQISRRLKEQWPRELTIILQHQYSDLEVEEQGFGVTLSFRGTPEHLYVPFAAVTGFYDPSVEFGLRFEAADAAPASDDASEEPKRPGPTLVKEDPEPAPAARAAPAKKADPAVAASTDQDATQAPDAPGAAEHDAKIVSIDAFRKKT